MVYPNDFIPSEPGGRDVIDDRDAPVPLVITLIRQGSSDHLQPNFPSPGEIRSMFNTSKIGECPEYANSPSTMSDPLEWRPPRTSLDNHIDMLEERLLRIHQWAENSFPRRPYEGNHVTITDISSTNESSIDNMVDDSDSDFTLQQTVFDLSESIKVNLLHDDPETRSDVKLIPSNDTSKSDEQESNQREYDVEEYVEQMNSNELNDSVSNLSCDYSKESDSIKTADGIDRETYVRIKQLEKIFKLVINENDTVYIKELKRMLLGKIRDYVRQNSDYYKMRPLNDTIDEVAEILNDSINHNDAVICDNVHDLCVKLKDILTLKEEMLGNIAPKYINQQKNEIQAERETDATPDVISYSDTSIKKNGRYDVNVSTEQSEESFEKDSHNEEIKSSNHEISLKTQSTKYENKESESFESLITFSRIPVANQSKVRSNINTNSLKMTHSKNLKSHYATKIPTYRPSSRTGSNKKHIENDESNQMKLNVNQTEKHEETEVTNHKVASRSSVYKSLLEGGNSNNSKQVKELLFQQKEELIKKATLLGLIDEKNDIAKVPHLTERAKLALLEKQIQGRLKSRQLALERKKTGLPERIIKLQGSKNNSKESTVFQKLDSLKISDVSIFGNIGNNEVSQSHQKITRTKESNSKGIMHSSNAELTPTGITADGLDEESSVPLEETSRADDIRDSPVDELKESSDATNLLPNEKQSEESNEKETNVEKETDSYLATEKEILVYTSFIAPKEKLVNWDDDEPTPNHSRASLQNNRKSRYKLLIFTLISILFAVFSIAFHHYRPELFEEYLSVCNKWVEVIKDVNWKDAINKRRKGV